MLADIMIKKSDLVVSSFFYNTFNEKYFEDPFSFYPERWMTGKLIHDPFIFAPFWAGPRVCIAAHMVNLELKAVLGEFLRNFNFKLDPNFKITMMVSASYGP